MLSSQEMDTATRVQILDETDCISHSTNTLGKGMNLIILPPAMGKQQGRLGSSAQVRQLIQEKDNSKFKPLKLRLKIDLVSYPARAEGLVNMIPCVQCGLMAQSQSFGSAFCYRWFNLLQGRSRYTLLMRPNKAETALQWFCMPYTSVCQIFWSQ